ncbi:PREDICTED: exosome complex component CSL4 isoform X3 [Nanorana parkeri]|uniref:exosome complex component CSL4 isoform X3 n=1 Tax=Nanorana parkeri TaxID=125878 RepID=UPI0008548C8F|nr:PREDICTED: exosome complex component CSL4 isoform X3 [Nanorana parkeri]
MAPVRWCVPGERLCSLEDCAPGHGTYCKHGYIFASLAGYVFKTSDNGLMPVLSVVRDADSLLLPDVGAIVTCKVMSINPRFAKVQIMYVGSRALKNTFKGTIRREDIRATEKDKVTGATMVPISWCEMQCPKTHIKEPRKVARVQPEFLQT